MTFTIRQIIKSDKLSLIFFCFILLIVGYIFYTRQTGEFEEHSDWVYALDDNKLRPHANCDYLTPQEAHLSSGVLLKRWKNYYQPAANSEPAKPIPNPKKQKPLKNLLLYSCCRIINNPCIAILGFDIF